MASGNGVTIRLRRWQARIPAPPLPANSVRRPTHAFDSWTQGVRSGTSPWPTARPPRLPLGAPRTYDGPVQPFLDAVGALIPSVGVGVLFWLGIRAIMRADRSEREALARFEAERDGVPVQANNAAARER